jgi:hypothetical protein
MQGQASAEYAGLLALAAVIGATLALIAGPPLAHAVSAALVAALGDRPQASRTPVASAADTADVASALLPDDGAITPDAALLAMARRDGTDDARAIADGLLLAAAREAVPWIGRERTYRGWAEPGDGPFQAITSPSGDHDAETPVGPPAVAWVTVGAQQRALERVFARPFNLGDVALDGLGLVPGASLARRAAELGATRAITGSLERLPKIVDAGTSTGDAIALVNVDDGGIPAGLRVGDIEITWPVRRTFWRAGRSARPDEVEAGFGSFPMRAGYSHTVILRPTEAGLRVVAEGGP